MYRKLILLWLLSCGAYAHEMTPTYPILTPSYVDGVSKVEMHLFNKRTDARYYEIGVFDKDFNPIPFVSSYHIVSLNYLKHLNFAVYISDKDKDRAVYVCTRSLIQANEDAKAFVASKICSKFKGK